MTTRAKIALTAALALGLGTAGFLARAESPRADEKPARVDAYGDELPAAAAARLGTLRWRHGAQVTFAAYAADGKQLVTASQDGRVHVWDADTGKSLHSFGFWKAIGGGPAPAALMEKEALKDAMIAQAYRLTALDLSADGKQLLVATPEGSFTLWDVAAGKETKTVKPNPAFGANLVVFAPDGKSFFARGYDTVLHHIDLAEGKELKKFGEAPNFQNPQKRLLPFQGPHSVAVSPDGKTLYSVLSEFENNQVTGLLRAWEVESGKEKPAVRSPQVQVGFNSMVFSADAKYVAWGHFQGGVHVWDVAAGKEVSKLAPPQPAQPLTLAFSPDGRTLAVRASDQSVRLWSVVEGKERVSLGDGPGALKNVGYRYNASDLAFSPDGKRVATGAGIDGVRQFDAGTGKELAAEPGGHHGAVTFVAVTPDGKTALTRAADNQLRVWDVAAGKETARHPLPPTAYLTAFSADAKTVALGAYDGTVTLWDPVAGKETKQWKAGAQPNVGFSFLALSPDGKTVAVRGQDNVIRLWDAGTARELRQLAQVDGGGTGAAGVELQRRAVPYRPMTLSLVFSPDGTQLAGMAFDNAGNPGIGFRGMPGNATVRLWDVATGKQVRRFDAPKNGVGIAALAFAPDGRTLATANYDGSITLWECASGKERATSSFKPPQAGDPKKDRRAPVPVAPAQLSCIAYSPDGKLLAAAGVDGLVRVCEALTGKEVATLKGHQAGVLGLVFAAGGKFLASASSDTTALVWETPAVPDDRPQGLALEEKQAEALWADLADADAAKAFVAVRTLSQVPAQAVPLLKGRVQAVPAPDAQKLAQLIADLDANTFAARKKAEDELEKMGELAEDALKQDLAGKPGLEMQKRLEGLLAKLVTGAPPHPNQLRALRALEVLEGAGTPEAKDVLQAVAAGAAGARLTKDAKGSLDRLAKR